MNDADVQNEPVDNEETEDRHIIHCPETCDFSIGCDYDYLRLSPIETLSYFTIRAAAQLILNIYNRLVFGLRVKGYNNLLKTLDGGGAVVVSNHVHMLDCTFIDCILPHKRVYYSTLETNFRIPYARVLMRLLGAVPIPLDIHKKPRFTGELRRALSYGSYVVMYPESVLDPYCGHLRRFHDGAFKLAASTLSPVLPVTVTFRRPQGLLAFIKRRPCVTLNILPPIDGGESGSVRERSDVMMEKCRKMMEDTIKEAYNEDTADLINML